MHDKLVNIAKALMYQGTPVEVKNVYALTNSLRPEKGFTTHQVLEFIDDPDFGGSKHFVRGSLRRGLPLSKLPSSHMIERIDDYDGTFYKVRRNYMGTAKPGFHRFNQYTGKPTPINMDNQWPLGSKRLQAEAQRHVPKIVRKPKMSPSVLRALKQIAMRGKG